MLLLSLIEPHLLQALRSLIRRKLVAFISNIIGHATTTRAWWSTPSTRNKKSGVKDLVISFFLLACGIGELCYRGGCVARIPHLPPPMFLIARPQKKWSCTGALFASLSCCVCGRLRTSSAGRLAVSSANAVFKEQKTKATLPYVSAQRFQSSVTWLRCLEPLFHHVPYGVF